MMTRSLLIAVLSLGVFLFSALVMYGVWMALDDLAALPRGIIALFFWIGAFSGATFGFWKITKRLTFAEALQ
jgi:hypothetical protein